MSSVADWATACGTVASAGLAAYFGVVQPRISRSRLVVGEPLWNCAQTNLPAGSVGGAWWIRVPVRNKSRTVTASDVKATVIAINAAIPPPDEPDLALAGFELSWTTDDESVRIPPGATRYLNVGFAYDVRSTTRRFQFAVRSGAAGDRLSRSDLKILLTFELETGSGRAFKHVLTIDPTEAGARQSATAETALPSGPT